MKYLEVRDDAVLLIEKEREEADKAKRGAGAERIKRLMLEIEQTKGTLATMERQLDELMEKDVVDTALLSWGDCMGRSVGYYVNVTGSLKR